MAIRITGMYSGLDTEAIISELVSAQSVKKNKYVREQTKLSWKMDAWKALNTKIYNFYTNTLDTLRWQASFTKKATKVSNSNAISVIPGSNAVDGTQSVKVWELAQTGKLTGADLSGKNITSSSKLSDLGIASDSNASFDVTVNGKKTTIELNGDMKISDVVKKLQNAGLNASFDDVNHRFFISAKETGAAADFSITANNEAGLNALKGLGLLSKEDLENDEYAEWAGYNTDGSDTKYEQLIEAEAAKRAASYKKANEDLAAKNESLKKELEDANKALEEAQNAYEVGKDNPTLTEDDIAALKAAADEAQKVVDDKNAQIKANEDQIKTNEAYYEESEPDENGNTTAIAKPELKTQVRGEFEKKVELAAKVVAGDYSSGEKDEFATRIVGQDAEIEVDGVRFKSSSNDFNINGMTITAYEKTDNYITITTSNDVDGIYDMIKNFFTEYNSLINEMSALYNADSAKGYDPLLSEEKAEMADSEIEEWEKKIKDSLLRRDSTLGDVSDAIKTVMLQGATVNGKTMYLSDFGINTLGYFNAGENEKNAYHINGDPDDSSVSAEEELLKKMIASDPDTVMNFFTGLANNLHDKLFEKMAGIKDTSSAFTVYNDKLMQKEYEAYKEKIAKEEEKLNALMDKWYGKFSQMETALAKLQSKSSGLSSMLGGQ